MTLFDKKMGEEKIKSLEFAEASREEAWSEKSFVAKLFQGKLEWDLIYPFPVQSLSDKAEGDKFLKRLEEFLKQNLNPDEVDETREIPDAVMKGLADMGAFAMKIPKVYGGLGFSQMNYNRAIHLVATYCGSTAALLSAHQSIGVPQPLLVSGTEEQKKKFLPRFRDGAISGFALTEPSAGSDPRLIKTTATPVEDGKFYLLNGEKLWCTNGNIADLLVVMAHTPPKIEHGKERPQVSAFIVEANTPGFEVSYRCKFMGLNAIQNGVIKLTNVKVPKENMILGEGEGLKLAFLTLNTGRLTLPAAVTGASKWCLWVSRKWAKERKQWGSPIGEHESIASKVSAMAANVFAMDAVMDLVSYMADNKKFDIRLEAAITKLFSTEASWNIIYDTIQIRGGRGYETAPSLRGRGESSYPVERAMRDSRINTILEGSSEIMYLFIARESLDFHLNKIKNIVNPRVSIVSKIKFALKAGFDYFLWYPTLWIPAFGKKSPDLPKALNKHARFVERASKKLARRLFHKMMIYQKGLVQKQNMLNRFVDIGMELFAISAVLSYTSAHLKKENNDDTIELADLFCRMSRERISKKFGEICCNNDLLSDVVSKKAINGQYDWLEEDIMKIDY